MLFRSLDFWAAVTDRHSEGFDGPALAAAPFGAPSPTVWGLPVVRSRDAVKCASKTGVRRPSWTLRLAGVDVPPLGGDGQCSWTGSVITKTAPPSDRTLGSHAPAAAPKSARNAP